ncbi:hypothetical protein L916_03179 [Phytophthora nicotianae]|uniref:Uncharacterized protein n=1 Tax=Phytophthora nicotianae TaxID=4792 RepID=W2JMQ6_PHYNI|nr:hypothetical protein L916_03179 [Phytophthora nicotianae]
MKKALESLPVPQLATKSRHEVRHPELDEALASLVSCSSLRLSDQMDGFIGSAFDTDLAARTLMVRAARR